jgi:hypothetical protein
MAKASDRRQAPLKKSAGQSRSQAARPNASDLHMELRTFAAGRPYGWNHDEWVGLLSHLEAKGHDMGDPERIGHALERERLAIVLAEVAGMGSRRIEAMLTRFETVWRLREASVEDIAVLPNIPRALAERTLETVRRKQF